MSTTAVSSEPSKALSNTPTSEKPTRYAMAGVAVTLSVWVAPQASVSVPGSSKTSVAVSEGDGGITAGAFPLDGLRRAAEGTETETDRQAQHEPRPTSKQAHDGHSVAPRRPRGDVYDAIHRRSSAS